MAAECDHLRQLGTRHRRAVQPSGPGCKECLETGDFWVHLRLCMACGHVGCCDDSPNRHATTHFHGTGHPVIKSFEPGEDWGWCFVDETATDVIPSFPQESPARHLSPPSRNS
jgi:uncharacterized UBP type Zn finger protein